MFWETTVLPFLSRFAFGTGLIHLSLQLTHGSLSCLDFSLFQEATSLEFKPRPTITFFVSLGHFYLRYVTLIILKNNAKVKYIKIKGNKMHLESHTIESLKKLFNDSDYGPLNDSIKSGGINEFSPELDEFIERLAGILIAEVECPVGAKKKIMKFMEIAAMAGKAI